MLSVSERAGVELRNIMQAQDVADNAVRVFIQGRCGCGAAHYGMAFDSQAETDTVLEANGLKIVLDEEALEVLDEATIDFVETPMSKGFTIDNPKAGAGCNCGHGH